MLPIRLIIILLSISIISALPNDINGQITEASNSNAIELKKDTDEMEFEKEDYRGLISSQYVNRFSEFSDKLMSAEAKIKRLDRQLLKIQDNYSSNQDRESKKIFKERTTEIKNEQKQLNEELKLIRKALKLMQINKGNTDPIKLSTLNKVNSIESDIALLRHKYNNQQTETILSAINVEDRNTYMDPLNDSCKLKFNGIDSGSKKMKKEMEKEFFFGYTHPKLKSYFKDKHFLICEAQMIQLNRKNYLWLHITISSKDAVKNYGSIEKNSPLKVELLNGDIIYAISGQDANGKLEAYTGNTNYLVMLPLDKSKVKQLAKSEIDRIGIMWTSGYEQYEIMEVDLIMNQIACINNN